MKLLNLTQYFFLVCILSFISYWIFCVTYPYKILEIKSVTSTKDRYYAGEPLEYVSDYCKYKDLSPTSYRELIDGVVYSLNATSANNPVGCHKVIMHAGYVPDIATGVYYLKMKNVYHVNPFRDVVVEFKTNKFEIISSEI